MKISIEATAAIAVLALAAGCGEVTFKRGASPEAATAAERECRAATEGEDQYIECMRKRGWFVMKTDEIDDKLGIGGHEEATPSPPAEPAAAAPASSASAPSSGAAQAAPAVGATAPSPNPAATSSSGTPAAAAASATVAAKPDPIARIEVSSWWKFGGTAAGLDAAIAACSTELGDAHRPEPGARVVTSAMKDCLRRAGWRAVGEKPVK